MLNYAPLKVCPNILKLDFNGGTTITNVDIPDILPHQFKFKSIEHFSMEIFNMISYMVIFNVGISLFDFITSLDYHLCSLLILLYTWFEFCKILWKHKLPTAIRKRAPISLYLIKLEMYWGFLMRVMRSNSWTISALTRIWILKILF